MKLLTIYTDRELAVTFLLLILISFWGFSLLAAKMQRKRHMKILTNGIESEATVIDIGPTGRYAAYNTPQIKVQIQVRPEQGRNYITEIKEFVPQVDFNLLHSGSRIIVKYDPSFPKEVVLMRTA